MKGVILMTALVPTIGHKALVEFARQYMESLPSIRNSLHLIISARSFEPVGLGPRVMAFEQMENVTLAPHLDDGAPQNPSTDAEWNYWVNTVRDACRGQPDFIFSSEPYGEVMAEKLGCKHIPFDIDRITWNVKGTNVRADLYDPQNFRKIMPEFRKNIRKVFTVFGQESVGKSTVVEFLASKYPDLISGVTEWARPYLMLQKDKTITPETMDTICHGQFSLQKIARTSTDTPFILQDTDLLSTIGYTKIAGLPVSFVLASRFKVTKSDHYFLLKDDVPFEPDPLRYGGNKRESDLDFWIKLLEQYECSYSIIETGTGHVTAAYSCLAEMRAIAEKSAKPIQDFVRD